MTQDEEQLPSDSWQTALYEASYRYSVALKKLHQTNPCPDQSVLANAINALATELWDRCFSARDISAAFENAVENLPSYTASDDIRP